LLAYQGGDHGAFFVGVGLYRTPVRCFHRNIFYFSTRIFHCRDACLSRLASIQSYAKGRVSLNEGSDPVQVGAHCAHRADVGGSSSAAIPGAIPQFLRTDDRHVLALCNLVLFGLTLLACRNSRAARGGRFPIERPGLLLARRSRNCTVIDMSMTGLS